MTAAAVPDSFHTSAARWARGAGTPLDESAVAAVSLGTPVGPPPAAAALGFDPATGLPRPETLDAFVAAKDAARSAAHAELSAAARRAIVDAAGPSGGCVPLPPQSKGTGAGAGALDGAVAAAEHVGVVLDFSLDELLPAGAEFVHALRSHGWEAVADAEGGRMAFRADEVGPAQAIRLALAAGRKAGDACPAGKLTVGDRRDGWVPRATAVACMLAGRIARWTPDVPAGKK